MKELGDTEVKAIGRKSPGSEGSSFLGNNIISAWNHNVRGAY